MSVVLSIQQVSKTYGNGVTALHAVDLEIQRGEIFALLGPNGAGKTTLIGSVCGLVRPTTGRILVDGHDVISDARAARRKIGLVPQELATAAFESVWATVRFSRGLFGKPHNPAYLEQVLRDLSLWDKRDARIMHLSGGMKRRVLIAKALAHEPEVLFLDEPTAGVDVELRRDMWRLVGRLRERGVTIVLTTHYIEEAEQMADRIGVINGGRLLLVEQKDTLMQQMGTRQLLLTLDNATTDVPADLADLGLSVGSDGAVWTYTFDGNAPGPGVTALIARLASAGVQVRDVTSRASTLEEIFVNLVQAPV